MTATFNGGTSYHIAGTYDGYYLRMYIDGVQVGTGISVGNGSHNYQDAFYL